VKNDKTGRILKPMIEGHGYLNVGLMKMKTRHMKKIHQLVAQVF